LLPRCAHNCHVPTWEATSVPPARRQGASSEKESLIEIDPHATMLGEERLLAEKRG
jgi:hypothetical protein